MNLSKRFLFQEKSQILCPILQLNVSIHSNIKSYDIYENGDYVRWRTDFSPSDYEAVNSYSSQTAIGVKNDEDDRISSTSYFTVRFIKGDETDINQNSDFLGLTIYPEY